MESDTAGSHLGITIEAELTTLKKLTVEFTILQHHTRSMKIMTNQHVGKHVVCGMDETRIFGSGDNFAGPL
eukprot:9536143-Ditylum_brightwellii.AAC.1